MSGEKSELPGLPGYHPDNLRPWLVAVTVSMTLLAMVAVCLRLISRRIKRQQLWLDDKMIMFSMGWNLAVVGFIFAMYSYGMGIHADRIDPADIVMMAKWLVVAEILYAWNLGWTKLSLLLMYYRIFHHQYFKKMAWIVGSFVMAWVLCITFLFIFICVPVRKLWYPQVPGHCINQVGTWIANSLSTILTDLIILLMPIPQIWQLALRKTEKIGLTLAFGLGFFVVFASAYRTSVLFTYTSNDPTYTLAPTVGWTVIEMSAGIVSACLPTLLPFVLHCAGMFGYKPTVQAPQRDTNAPPTFGGSGGKRGKCRSGSITLTTFGTRGDEDGQVRGADGPFHRLPDSMEPISAKFSEVNLPYKSTEVQQAQLRPDVQDNSHSVKSYTARGNDDGKDGVPPQGIRVHKDFRRSTSKKGPGP